MQEMRRYAALLLGGFGLLGTVGGLAAQRPEATPAGLPPGLPVIATSVPVTTKPVEMSRPPLVITSSPAPPPRSAPPVQESPVVRVSVASNTESKAPAAPPPLFLEKQGPSSLEAGTLAHYELLIRNTGSQLLQHVRVEDELPAGVVLVESEPAARVAEGRLTWDLASLEPGVERRVRVCIRAMQSNEFRATATATFTASATLTALVTPSPLSVRIQGPERALPGEGVHFEVAIQNAGTTPFRRVLLRDHLPPGLKHPRGPLVESEVGALDPGETRIIPLDTLALAPGVQDTELTITADAGPTVTQRASVLVVQRPEPPAVPPPSPPPPAPPPNTTPPLLPASFRDAPTLRLDVAGPSTALRTGAEVEYFVKLVNPGSTKATNVEVEADLTSGLEIIGAEGPQRHSLRAQRVLFDPLPELAPHAEVPLRLRVRATRPGTFRLILAAGCDQAVESVSRELAVRVVSEATAAKPASASYAGTYQEINKR